MVKAVGIGMLKVVEEFSFVAIGVSGNIGSLQNLGFNIVPGLADDLRKLFPGPLMLRFPLGAGLRLNLNPGSISIIISSR
jgi:hypothetical protein